MTKRSTAVSRIIDRVDFNATTHGQRDLDGARLSNLIEAISTKRLGLDDVEAEAREADAALREILRKIGI